MGQAHIAEPHRDVGAPEQVEPFEREPEHLRIRRRGVAAPDRLDAALHELVGLARRDPEDGTEIAVIGALARPRRLMQAADGNREFRTQAEFGPGRVLRHEDAPPYVLARQFEEGLHRLQHGGEAGTYPQAEKCADSRTWRNASAPLGPPASGLVIVSDPA
ncbi:hypothetical protein GCM10025880_44550 [Methylorubrum aminovorans]|nr:hypothetical protein GCM10025880_44550 [Methylorubrum aminovorans]